MITLSQSVSFYDFSSKFESNLSNPCFMSPNETFIAMKKRNQNKFGKYFCETTYDKILKKCFFCLNGL